MSPSVLHAGILRHRAEFLRRDNPDVHDVDRERWKTVFTCWCGVEPVSGREYRDADAVYWEDETRFIIRYRTDVYPDMRIRLGKELYEITAIVDRNYRHEALEITGRMVNHDGGRAGEPAGAAG